MKIIISPEENVKNETNLINQFFDQGLDLFHIRKPTFSNLDLISYVFGIKDEYKEKLVVHQLYETAFQLGLRRFHIKENVRKNTDFTFNENLIYSTSTHSIDDFNQLGNLWEYAFISPIFPSISKIGYGENSQILSDLKKRTNCKTKLIGLGGITPENQHFAYENGVVGVAFLGSIWENENPLKIFEKCIQKGHLY
ncbi:thiamine-phosphate pyrophosphorylase [Soonwooa buanensis]|uniref:Thiamine-phosphate pyrophosphorylase n=1 Tax=Soonwooa buanensis TaxID=619805 RepID=A0A1T5G619_9FLAO|nr:thiamine phosphate synthase [Soonwooa buanensis]SKC03799.1 thiamine-phosphate pyrophosphorylase [Soonwooa buanensis]